ncbi:PAS domain S-box protein [Mucilaginibacter limnophilus]|uniref:Oxygen sensor histidine kinase NreB n=1 Tax=Mucilaginibacter limnophilus TaxID=1932778 RepID=A0A3S2V3J1_9SPHI|nr:PAS domain S-box protein [Mucilaginibacter limnophilus]RVU02446.1 PAS domain S-box protein [Mucilaginibacter limnophilus]
MASRRQAKLVLKQEIANAEKALSESEEKYRLICESMDEALALCLAVRNADGQLVDYYWLEVNKAQEQLTGLSRNQMIGKLRSESPLYPDVKSMQLFNKVLDTGQPVHFETNWPAKNGWINVRAFPLNGDRFVALTYDITERKNVELALRKSEARTREIIETGAVSVLFFNNEGVLIDANDVFIESMGWTKNDIASGNISWRTITPPDWLPTCEVLEKQLSDTGHIQASEKEYLSKDGKRSWMLFAARKLGDGTIVEFAIDINARKRAEAALRKAELQHLTQLENEVHKRTAELKESHDLLQATLDSSSEMIQVFKAIRDEDGKITDFVWVLNNHASEQIYGDVIGKSLLQNNPGVVATGIFNNLIKVTETGVPQQYEKKYVHEQFNGWFYQSVVKLGDGVITNTTDITERKRAEQRLRRIEKEQQKKIFRITLDTQEEERRRIAENLHNGLGQLLYGVRISLAHLTLEQATDNPDEFKKDKAYTDRLLSEAITEIRNISHELVPAVFEEFGLTAAIDEVCKQFQDSFILNYSIQLPPKELDKYLQLTIYRTVQELLTNVVKHAKATKTDFSIYTNNKNIVIVIKDNGCGITLSNKTNGVGLTLIKAKIKLLNGSLTLSEGNDNGTMVTVTIPF